MDVLNDINLQINYFLRVINHKIFIKIEWLFKSLLFNQPKSNFLTKLNQKLLNMQKNDIIKRLLQFDKKIQEK